MPNLWEINYKFCKIECIKWTTGWLMPHIPCQSSIWYLWKRLLTNQLNDTEPSLALTPGFRPVENLPTVGVWMNSIFINCENVEFWNRTVQPFWGISILAVAQSSWIEKSCEGVSRWRPGHLYSATRLVAWVTCLCSVHSLFVNVYFLVQWWLGYEFCSVNGMIG
jgi:hypothetical protein